MNETEISVISDLNILTSFTIKKNTQKVILVLNVLTQIP